DLTGSGRPDLIAVFMDNPSGGNNVFYRIGQDLDTSGFTANWSVDIPVPGSWGTESAGMAAAPWDLGGSGLPDLVIPRSHNPNGGNAVHYRFGRNIAASGTAAIWNSSIQIQGG